MSIENDKMSKGTQGKSSMIFYFSWFDSLNVLSPEDYKRMGCAISDYAQNGNVPSFDGLLLAYWKSFEHQIDMDNQKYLAICQKNQKNIQKRWGAKNTTEYDRIRPNTTEYDRIRPYTTEYDRIPANTTVYDRIPANTTVYDRIPANTTVYDRIPNDTKNTDDDNDNDDNLKETVLSDGKENGFSLNDETFSLPVDFTRWTQSQFVVSVDEAIVQHPEFAPLREQFVGYWTEPDKRGKMRFAREKAWRTYSRLKTFLNRAKTHGNGTNGDSNSTGQIDFADEIRKMQEI